MRGAAFTVAICCLASGSLAESVENRFRIWDGERVPTHDTSPWVMARCIGMTDALIHYGTGGLLVNEQKKAGTREEIMALAASGKDILHRKSEGFEVLTRAELDKERAIGEARFQGANEVTMMDPFSEPSISYMQSMQACANLFHVLRFELQAENGI